MRWIVILIFSILAGCSTLPTTSFDQTWSGRFSIQLQKANKSEHLSGSFRLGVRNQLCNLYLSGPLGTFVAELVESSSGVVLRTADGKTIHSDDFAKASHQLLGFEVPVSDLTYWLEGKPIPTLPAEISSIIDHKQLLQQKSWKIVLTWDNTNTKVVKLQASRPEIQEQPEINLTLIPKVL